MMNGKERLLIRGIRALTGYQVKLMTDGGLGTEMGRCNRREG